MNIKELLEEDGFSCKKAGNHDGGVYGSPCPWCGGVDRFRCWPNADNCGNYFCQQCGRKGIAVKYLVEYRGMEYAKACAFLEYIPKVNVGGLRNRRLNSTNQWRPKESDPLPSPQWQSQANIFVHNCVDNLWSHHPEAIEWLHDRGLKDDTIRKFKIGWNDADQWYSRESWGSPAVVKENGTPKKLWIPAGLVIPYETDGNIIRIRIRNTQGSTYQKYYLLEGSSNTPTIIGTLPSVILVESDLDAFLTNQEAGDLATTIALGSANIRPDKSTVGLLRKSEIILNALDNDTAGAQSYWTWWGSYFPASIRWPAPIGKDPSDAFQEELCIKDWIVAGLSSAKISGNGILQTIESTDTSDSIVLDDHDSAIRKLEHLNKSGPIIIHLRTAGHDLFRDKIAAIQIFGKPDVLLSLNPGAIQNDTRDLLTKLFENDARKIFHNAKSQLKALSSMGLKVNGPYFDTMLAAQVLKAGIKDQRNNLQSLSIEYLEHQFPEPIDTIKHLINEIVAMLNAYKLSDVAELEFSSLPAIVEMELHGINLDTDKWNMLGNDLTIEKELLEKTLYAELGKINLDNPKEILTALIMKGINLPNTKRQTFMMYEDQYPILTQIKEYRRYAKLIQGFIIPIPKFVDDHTGRIHAEYHQLGASTGRITCRKPNLQQLPRDKAFRSCIKAPSGHRLIIADYSQIELRIVAETTGDETMIKAYQNGQDLHKMTASIITGKPFSQISKNERQAAKAVNFGLIYAMGAEGLMTYAQTIYGVSLTTHQAQDFISRFFNAYSGVGKWHGNIRECTSNETRTLSGRRRLWENKPPLTEKLNTPIQGTSADILKKALSILPFSLKGTGSKIMASVHDEIILETPRDHAEEASNILVQTMITAGEHYLKNVPVEVDVTISDNWADK